MVCFDVSSYNYKNFNNLPSLHAAKATFENKSGIRSLAGLGKIFRSFNQHRKFGLILLHKHFEMSADEFTVESLSESKTISMPWHLAAEPTPVAPEFLEKNGFTTENTSVAVRPHSWIFNADGSISPYEFYLAKDPEVVEIPQDFLQAFHEELKMLKFDTVLGLHLLHRGDDQISVESTVVSARANVLDLKPKFDESVANKMVNVIWTFENESGIVKQVCFCSGGADDGGHVYVH